MRGDAVFGDLMHAHGSDLQFNAMAFGAEDAGVQGAVAVRLGRRDVILESPRYHWVSTVCDTECLVAIVYVLDDEAKCHDVRKLFETDFVLLHLTPDRIRRFLATADLGVDAMLDQYIKKLIDDASDQILAFGAQKL